MQSGVRPESAYRIISPVDGELAFEVPYLDPEAALARLRLAREAQAQWRTTSLQTRIDLCRAMLGHYEAQLESHAGAITRMMGKPIDQARAEFRGGTRERTLAMCDLAAAALAPTGIPADSSRPELERWICREPVGVVLDIAAWNYPLLVAINVIVPAVLAGNAVLIKHAPQTALVGEQFETAFRAAGAPAGLVQACFVDHDTVASLLQTRSIDHVAFTGSVAGGQRVYATSAAACLASVCLELGGKDPAVVLDDCDFDHTVAQLVDGSFYNAGQSCCAVERIYVEQPLYARFVEAFVAASAAMRVGDPRDEGTQLGPLVNVESARRIDQQVDRAIELGARLATPIADPQRERPGACYRSPRVLIDVDHRMEVMVEETFGPVIGIMPFDTRDRGLQFANDSRYGLTASIWTRDRQRARYFLDQFRAGTVYLNRCDAVDPMLAWTGHGDSGLGCGLSKFGFDHLTRPKNYNLVHRPLTPHA